MSPAAFYDSHCHALTLSHPSFLAFVETLRHRRLESLYSQVVAPDYLISALFFKTGERIRNMLSVMENDVGSIFALMEDDLEGVYAKAGEREPLVRAGRLRLGGLGFDRLVLVPLIMDFWDEGGPRPSGTYYDRPPTKPVEAQQRDVLEGIRDYRRSRPSGFLEIRPFLGVDTRHYGPEALAGLLERSFAGFSRDDDASRAAFASMADYDEAEEGDFRFAGVKVYPPLGFDPWPSAGVDREKAELLWSFCEKRGIPVVTHCDDQGFRVIPLEESWAHGSPAHWEAVLERHPSLYLDFAHFGAQYVRPLGKTHQSTEWTDTIVRLMAEYPHAYADFSFNGTEAEYYRWLEAYLGRLHGGLRSTVEDRLLFGSDFMVSLSRIRSYADYYRVFSDSVIPDELKLRFGHDNPERFLFGE